jgi:hypothetical protein
MPDTSAGRKAAEQMGNRNQQRSISLRYREIAPARQQVVIQKEKEELERRKNKNRGDVNG